MPSALLLGYRTSLRLRPGKPPRGPSRARAPTAGRADGNITGISKKGWEYLTVLYEDAKQDTPKKILPKPVAVYVNKVYGESNFSGLGIG